MNILELVQNESGYKFRRATANECKGPCPFCRAGDDRFRLWLNEGRYWCRVCGKQGDAIQFTRDYKSMGYRDACSYLGRPSHYETGSLRSIQPSIQQPPRTSEIPPKLAWQNPACDFVLDCAYHLMGSSEGDKARAWLHKRTLSDVTLNEHRIGFNPTDQWVEREAWGLPSEFNSKGDIKKLWLPRGIVIPWWIDGDLWGIRIRRPVSAPKYYWLPGGTLALYNADALTPNQPAALLEGEFGTLTLSQTAGDLVTAVATGSTCGARRTKWIARLSTASVVLVAFDADDPGDTAAQYWLDNLPNARRWRPFWGDANDMAQDGVDVRSWIEAGVLSIGSEPFEVDPS
jgi:DNA primase